MERFFESKELFWEIQITGKNMKKVLVYGLKNINGGLENYLLSMQKRVSDDLHFIYMFDEVECVHKEIVYTYNGELVNIPKRRPIKNYLSVLNNLLKEYRKEIDTLYVNVNGISSDIVVILLGVLNKYKVYVHCHHAMMEYIENPFYRRLHAAIEFTAINLLKVIKIKRMAVSDRAGEYLFRNKEYSIVCPGIETGKFLFDSNKRELNRKGMGLSQEDYVYGFIGRLEKIKNPEFLLEVFHEIYKQKKESRLVLFGDGTLRERLEEIVKGKKLDDKVIFAGNTNCIDEFYHILDYVIMPSISEGLSLVAIEAQASGIPVACSEGRFPKSIAVTPLVKYIPLEKGCSFWADACIGHGNHMKMKNRIEWNDSIKKSIFDLRNASGKLKDVLMENNNGEF